MELQHEASVLPVPAEQRDVLLRHGPTSTVILEPEAEPKDP
jgi:hypothetical protein